MALEKIYTPIGWQNKPSTATPLGSHNLSKIDEALAEIDERVVELSEDTELLDESVREAKADITQNAEDITRLNNSFTGFSTAMSQGMQVLSDRIDEADAKIKNNTEDIDALKIIPTASGNTAYMDDASNMNLENIIFYGESKQMQTTGKNELQNTAVTRTDAGLTYTVNSDESVTVNGTATGLSIVKVGNFKNTDRDLILSGCPSGGNTNTYKLSYYHETTQVNDFGSGVALPKNDLTYEVRIVIYGGTTINNLTFKPMIRDASIIDATYEPYTGGKPAPNPDYPQPIESKTVNRVDVYGKNLLNPSGFTTKTSNGVTFTPVFKDGLLQYINVNGTATADSYYAIIDKTNVPKEALVLNGCEGGSASTYSLLITYRNEDDTYADQAFQSQTDADLPIDASKKKYSVTIFVKSGATVNNARIYPMLRPSFFTDGTYEPYQSQTKILATGTYRLDGIGDLKNYYDAKRGVFGEKVDRVTFDGSDDEHWATYDTGSGKKRLYSNSVNAKSNINNSTIPNILCSHYKPVTPTNTFYDIVGITISTGANPVLYLYDDVFNDGDIAKWRAHLQANPMTVVYELAEPEEGNLISSVKDDFAEFLKLHTYKPNTVVMNGADAEMDVSYVADPQLYIDKKFETLASAIVNQ